MYLNLDNLGHLACFNGEDHEILWNKCCYDSVVFRSPMSGEYIIYGTIKFVNKTMTLLLSFLYDSFTPDFSEMNDLSTPLSLLCLQIIHDKLY